MTAELENKRGEDKQLDKILTEYHDGKLTADQCVGQLQKYGYVTENTQEGG